MCYISHTKVKPEVILHNKPYIYHFNKNYLVSPLYVQVLMVKGTKMKNKFNIFALRELIICQVVGKTSKQITFR